MAATVLPEYPAGFKGGWGQGVLPYYEDLVSRPLDTSNVETWLADWSRFESLLSEAAALANFAYTCDTSDPDREAAQLRFGTQISPRAQEQRVRLQKRLVELDYMRPGIETMLQRFRNQMEIFDEANVPLTAELSELGTQWNKINGAMTVQWDGEEKTPAQLLPFLHSLDRDERERAFMLLSQPYIQQHAVLAGIFDRLYDLRPQVAKNSGFANYRDFAHREKKRSDYTPEDCMRFHVAVEEAVLPAIERINDRRRRRRGLDALAPLDITAYPLCRPPLKPSAQLRGFIGRGWPV